MAYGFHVHPKEYTADVRGFSFVVERDGDLYKAYKSGKGLTFEDDDASAVMQSVMDVLPSEGGRIILRTGIYDLRDKVIGAENCVLEGEVIGRWGEYEIGTVLNYVGASAEPVLDFTGKRWFGVRHLKINGNGVASDGIWFGTETLETRPKYLLLEDLEINGCGTGLNFGDPSWAGTPDDTTLRSIRIKNCTYGIRNAHTMVRFHGGLFAGCDVAIYLKGASRLIFYSFVFSGNKTDILYPSGDTFVNTLDFHNCWFEGESESILRKEDTTKASIGGVNFYGCNFACASDPASWYAIDAEHLAGQIAFYGGRVDPTSNRKIRVGADAVVNMYNMQVEWDLGASSISGIVRREVNNILDVYERLYVYAGKRDGIGWITVRPRGTPTTPEKIILDLHFEDKLTDTPILRIVGYNDRFIIDAGGLGSYTPKLLTLYQAGNEYVRIGDDKIRFQRNTFDNGSSISIDAGSSYTLPVGAWYVNLGSNTVAEVYDDVADAWIEVISAGGKGLVISDGSNARLRNTGTATESSNIRRVL